MSICTIFYKCICYMYAYICFSRNEVLFPRHYKYISLISKNFIHNLLIFDARLSGIDFQAVERCISKLTIWFYYFIGMFLEPSHPGFITMALMSLSEIANIYSLLFFFKEYSTICLFLFFYINFKKNDTEF